MNIQLVPTRSQTIQNLWCEDDGHFLNHLDIIYKNYNIQTLQNQDNRNRIPQIFHFIWLGSDLPTLYSEMILKWSHFHSDWKIEIWNDMNIVNIPLINQKEYNSAKNFGMKSDILRYEILYNYGGVYVDIDYECIRNCSHLLHNVDFFAGISNTPAVEINNGIIGSIAGHPILLQLIEGIKKNFRHQESKQKIFQSQNLQTNIFAFLQNSESLLSIPSTSTSNSSITTITNNSDKNAIFSSTFSQALKVTNTLTADSRNSNIVIDNSKSNINTVINTEATSISSLLTASPSAIIGSSIILPNNDKNEDDISQTIRYTGPGLLTMTINAYLQHHFNSLPLTQQYCNRCATCSPFTSNSNSSNTKDISIDTMSPFTSSYNFNNNNNSNNNNNNNNNNSYGIVVIFPYFIFHPVPNHPSPPSLLDSSEEAHRQLEVLKSKYVDIFDEASVAIHWWQCSWQPSKRSGLR